MVFQNPVGDYATQLTSLIRNIVNQEKQAGQVLQYGTVIDGNTVRLDANGYDLYANESDFVILDRKPLVPGSRVLATTMDRGTVVVWGAWNAPPRYGKIGPLIAQTEMLPVAGTSNNYNVDFVLSGQGAQDGFVTSFLRSIGATTITIPHVVHDWVDGIWVRAWVGDFESDRSKMTWGPGGIRDDTGNVDATTMLVLHSDSSNPRGRGPRILVRWLVRPNGEERIYIRGEGSDLPEDTYIHFHYAI